MSLGKPDITKFDSDDDSIRDARPEIQTAFTSLNTIIDEYNNGTLKSNLSNQTFTTVSAGATINVANGFAFYDINTQDTVTLELDQLDLNQVHYLGWYSSLGNTGLVNLSINGSGQESSANNTTIKFRRLSVFSLNETAYDSAGSNFYILRETLYPTGPHSR